MAPLSGPPATIFFSSSSLLHSSNVGRMNLLDEYDALLWSVGSAGEFQLNQVVHGVLLF